VAVNQKSTLLAYGKLLGIIAVAAAVGVDFIVSQNMATDPYARPDPFTGSDFERFRDGEFNELKQQVRECQRWRENHTRWGRERAGRNDEVHRNLEKSLSDIQSQVLYLYQQQQRHD